MHRFILLPALALTLSLTTAMPTVQQLAEKIQDGPTASGKNGLYRQLVASAMISGQAEPALNFLTRFIHSRYQKTQSAASVPGNWRCRLGLLTPGWRWLWCNRWGNKPHFARL